MAVLGAQVIALVEDAFASWRITRLIVKDDLFEAPRRRFVRWAEDGDGVLREKLAELAVCPHCVGVWVAFGVLVLRWRYPRQWRPIARALSCAAAVSIVALAVDSD